METEKIIVGNAVNIENHEKNAECEFIVPDYFPDILKVIKTEAAGRIRSKRQIAGEIIVDTMVEFRVFYISEGSNSIKCIVYPYDIGVNIPAAELDENSCVRLSVRTESSGCKVLSSRKIAPFTKLIFTAKTQNCNQYEIVSYSDDKNLQLRRSNIIYRKPQGKCDREIFINEEIEIPSSMHSCGGILKCDAEIECSDVKLLENKAVVKGVATVNCLYASAEDESVCKLTDEFTFTQIMEVEGITEQSFCDVSFNISDCVMSPKETTENNVGVISVELSALCSVISYDNSEISVITDAYDTEKNCKINGEKIGFERQIAVINDKVSQRNIIKLSDTLSEICDLSVTNVLKNTFIKDENVVFEGMTCFSLIAKASNGEAFETHSEIPFTHTYLLKNIEENLRIDPAVSVKGVSYYTSDEKEIEVKYELSFNADVYKTVYEYVVNSIEYDEENPKEKPDTAAVTLYFAKKGECVWDIAKNYNTSREAINELNELSDENLSADKMLIIPKRAYL